MGTFRYLLRDSNAVCQYVDVIGHSLSECNSQVLIYSKLHEKNLVIAYL